MKTILFVCQHNASLSILAQACLEKIQVKNLHIKTAGIDPQPIHPATKRILKQYKLELKDHTPQSVEKVQLEEIDLAVLFGDSIASQCPLFFGNPAKLIWQMNDPLSSTESSANLDHLMEQAFQEMERHIHELVHFGYLDSFINIKSVSETILDSLSDGILVHDMNRKFFYGNKAAERITGFSLTEISGQDCHSVFSMGICSHNCPLQNNEYDPEKDIHHHQTEIRSKDGKKKRLQITRQALLDSKGNIIGLINAFRDMTREFELARRLGKEEHYAGIIGKHKKMELIFELIHDLSHSHIPVMILGESGTGKELIASAIHEQGIRAKKKFVPVNCSALPENLIESELFGHVKGSFTGAIRDKKGRFELADEGTIFLDEIGDISPTIQVKLLRVLQEGAFERVGSEDSIKVDVRVICATNKDLNKEIREGRFREDLYYRLCVMPIEVPPLRERRTDIPLIIRYFLKQYQKDFNHTNVVLSQEVQDILYEHDWPGNIRELQNVIQHALIKCKGEVVHPDHLPTMLTRQAAPKFTVQKRKKKLDVESVYNALNETNGNKVRAAELLRVSRATLYRFLEKEGLTV